MFLVNVFVKKYNISFFAFCTVLLIVSVQLSSCKKDKISTSSSDKLSFSLDTLSFDTVFSSIGSSTRIFKIYNPNSNRVRISSIALGGGTSSFFKINVNGRSSTVFNDLELRAKDSIWVFAKVTIDPSNSDNPFLVKDSLVCVTNGNTQQVNFEAVSQDVYFHKPSSGESTYELPCGDVWKSDKPHLVYGTALVDTNCQLMVEAGTKVYFHNNGSIRALKGASLKINGTRNSPVLFGGDRLEPWYNDVAGQWLGIELSDESLDHEMNFLYLKNAQKGLFSEANEAGQSTSLVLNNCSFLNCSQEGVHFINASVKAFNLLVGNCVANELLIEKGGSYEFMHSTFANYVSEEAGQSVGNSVRITNWRFEEGETLEEDLVQCDFHNCLIYGNGNNELTLDNGAANFNYSLNNSLVAIQGKSNADSEFSGCVFNANPWFKETSEGDFQLKDNSAAIDIGDLNVIQTNAAELNLDYGGNGRLDGMPDAGVYEWIP